MKSEVTLDERTPYTMAIFNRNNKEKKGIRLNIVRYAQAHGIKPAERHFGCRRILYVNGLETLKNMELEDLKIKAELRFLAPIKLPKP